MKPILTPITAMLLAPIVVMMLAMNVFAQPYIPEEGSAELSAKSRKQTPAKVDPNLPNVLIIGDSISIGYTGTVSAKLAGKANVVHNPGNAEGVELHHLKSDRVEEAGKEQSKEHPEIVARLTKLALDWKATLPTKVDPTCVSPDRRAAK